MDFTFYTDDFDYQDVITIEYLRQFYSCSTCGCSWQDDHFSLDCDECGDYAMSKPCVLCDGKCGSMFRRNLALSHERKMAIFEQGYCPIKNNSTQNNAKLENSCLINASKASNLSKSTNLNSAASFIQTGLKVS